MAAADTGHMAVGMNLESVVDWSPAWTFTDAFKASRPWIAQAFNERTWATSWDAGASPPLDLDADGNVRSLRTWTQDGDPMRQFAGTLMFRGLGGGYAGGTYRAEWDGSGTVTFGFDAVVTARGVTAAGRSYADLAVTPTDDGIFMRIEATSPADPVRNVNVWMPDWNGRSFVGQRWQPGAPFSPFHPLFLERLAPFSTLRFMAIQETNTSDVATWADRRDAADVRQGSGPQGTPSEPVVNGMSLEYMVALANELDADPWFNMPHLADDEFVTRFATYVRDHLEPERTVYVEWANEVWNFGWGFEASAWIDGQTRLPENAGLDPDLARWIIAGREAKRDFDLWGGVFSGQTQRLVRVAAGQAANAWIVEQIASHMEGAFDAIALAPYITFTDAQRQGYTAATTVDRILADARVNLETALDWTRQHAALAARLSTGLGRPVRLVAYEGGPHLDGRDAPYQAAFHAATHDPRMADVYRDYLRGLDAAGLDLYVDFQFTGAAAPTPWGDFAKLHRMDQPLGTAHNYAAVVAAADGSLWAAPPPALVSVGVVDGVAAEAGLDPGRIRFTRTGGDLGRPLDVSYVVGGTATPAVDYHALSGIVTFAAGATTADVPVRTLDDAGHEPVETVLVTATSGPGYTLAAATPARVVLVSDDPPPPPVVSLSSAAIAEGHVGRRRLVFVITLSAASTQTVSVRWATSNGTALAGRDYTATSGTAVFPAGQRTQQVGVWIVGDRVTEADETFFVTLSAPLRATLSTAGRRATGTILDDDGLQRLAAFAAFGGAGVSTKKT